LSDALNATISLNLKLKEEMNYFLVLDALIDDASSIDIELLSLAMNIKGSLWG
jgi:hypothetical protein